MAPSGPLISQYGADPHLPWVSTPHTWKLVTLSGKLSVQQAECIQGISSLV